MIFGKERNKGIRLDRQELKLEVVVIGENGITEADVLVHDETNKMMARMLTGMHAPEFPEPVGVIYSAAASAYVSDVYMQRISVREKKGPADLNALLRSGQTWTVD